MHLFAAAEEELVGVHAIGDGVADKGHPVEDEGRIAALPRQQKLAQDVQHTGGDEESAEAGQHQQVRGLSIETSRDDLCDVSE